MSAGWDSASLLAPIADGQPCGENLEYTTVSTLESWRLFGQREPIRPQAARTESSGSGKEQAPLRKLPDWNEVRATALDGLKQSKDLRLLAYLGTAALWTDSLTEFVETLRTAAKWLEEYWPDVYPLVDGDGLARRNALNCLADRMAVLDQLTYLPLANSRRHGVASLKAIDLAAERPPVTVDVSAEKAATIQAQRQGAIQAAFDEVPLGPLVALEESVTAGLAALTSIDSSMRSKGPEAAPTFELLQEKLGRIRHVLREQIAAREKAQALVETAGDGAGTGLTAAPAAPGPTTVAVSSAPPVVAGGAIASRQDAILALDAVAEFFRRHEPSSPVPLFVDRAKRLVSKNFLEVLADVAPDALPGARTAGGLKPDQ
jgi:type VI secretion system protein ImpA